MTRLRTTIALFAAINVASGACAAGADTAKEIVEKSRIQPMPDFIMTQAQREAVIHDIVYGKTPKPTTKKDEPRLVKKTYWHRLEGIVKDQKGRVFLIVDGKEVSLSKFSKQYGRVLGHSADWIRASLKGVGTKVIYVGDKFKIIKLVQAKPSTTP